MFNSKENTQKAFFPEIFRLSQNCLIQKIYHHHSPLEEESTSLMLADVVRFLLQEERCIKLHGGVKSSSVNLHIFLWFGSDDVDEI